MFMVGERDPVRHYAGQHEAGLKDWLTDLRSQTVLPAPATGCSRNGRTRSMRR